MSLTILAAPVSQLPDDLGRWLRDVGRGAGELIQETSREPEQDETLRMAVASLATDLGEVCEAAATYIAEQRFELVEDDFADRTAEVARLLRVGMKVFGSKSRERESVEKWIAERHGRARSLRVVLWGRSDGRR